MMAVVVDMGGSRCVVSIMRSSVRWPTWGCSGGAGDASLVRFAVVVTVFLFRNQSTGGSSTSHGAHFSVVYILFVSLPERLLLVGG